MGVSKIGVYRTIGIPPKLQFNGDRHHQPSNFEVPCFQTNPQLMEVWEHQLWMSEGMTILSVGSDSSVPGNYINYIHIQKQFTNNGWSTLHQIGNCGNWSVEGQWFHQEWLHMMLNPHFEVVHSKSHQLPSLQLTTDPCHLSGLILRVKVPLGWELIIYYIII